KELIEARAAGSAHAPRPAPTARRTDGRHGPLADTAASDPHATDAPHGRVPPGARRRARHTGEL
ncbi:MAG TPA: hypothetical protein VK421_10115, partial [Pyrinomonadaceae bacterium]|nr:hypothetical protein [Pyrinomonadaceae bacterium]